MNEAETRAECIDPKLKVNSRREAEGGGNAPIYSGFFLKKVRISFRVRSQPQNRPKGDFLVQ